MGISFVEVMVALTVLAVGVIAAAHLQAISLQFSSKAEAVKLVTKVAQGELEWRRQTVLDLGITDCQSDVPGSFSECTVEITPCTIVTSTNTFVCSSDVLSPVAYEIVVSATGPRSESISLRTLHTGIYVAGGPGGLGDAWVYPESGAGDDEGAPTVP
jgi:Tfp pilus assembly protein PilX